MDSVLLVGSVPKPCSSRPLLQFPSHAKFSAVTKGSLVRSQVLNSTAWNSPEKYQLGRLRGPLVNQYVKGDGQKLSLYGRVDHKGLVNATSEQHFESEPESHNHNSPWKSIQTGVDVFYRFSRPHTVIGTALSILSVSLLAVQRLSDFTPLYFTGLTEAIVAALFMNIYIVGLNQLSDIDIDKEYSVGTGIMIVASCALTSFGLGWVVGSWPLFWALFVSFVLGTAYSINLPFLRWKRFAFLAASCILAVRAVIVQLAFFLHIQVLGHVILASILWFHAKSIDLKSKDSITSFYMFIWKLFYAEYLLIPLLR